MMKKFKMYLFLLALCLCLAACGKEKEENTEAAEETAEERLPAEGNTYPGAIRVAVPGEDSYEYFGVMHGCVLDVQADENGNPVFTVRDDEDPENAWTVASAFVKDVTLVPEKGDRAAFFFYGDIENDPDGVEMIAIWPDGTYELKVMDGITAESTVDDFEVWKNGKESGVKLRFLKNNCLADKDVTEAAEGTGVRIVYVDSGSTEKYPLRIYRNTEGN